MNYNEYKFNTREFRNPKFYDSTKQALGIPLDWLNETKICSNLDSNIFNRENFIDRYDSCHFLMRQFDSVIQVHQQKIQSNY